MNTERAIIVIILCWAAIFVMGLIIWGRWGMPIAASGLGGVVAFTILGLDTFWRKRIKAKPAISKHQETSKVTRDN